MLHTPTPAVLLEGNLVHDDGTSTRGFVTILHGTITRVASTPPDDLPAGAVRVALGEDFYVYPGLINLHTHVDYNLLPVWDNLYLNRWDNRFEWRGWDAYKAAIADPIGYVRDHWEDPLHSASESALSVGVAFQAMSELQAVAGGTTLLQTETSLGHGPGAPARAHVLIRNTGTASDLQLPPDAQVDSQVDFYAPDPRPTNALPPRPTDAWVPTPNAALQDYLNTLGAGTTRGVLVHLAEGRSGVGLVHRGVDAYSRAEFEAFRDTLSAQPPEAVRASHVGLIHGCGMDAFDPASIAWMRDLGVSLIWSPVSNMLLYGDTSFAYGLMRCGVNVALGSDWSPSGSKHVLDEARYARFYLRALGLPCSDLTLYRMITTHAAQALNLPAGRIAPGHFGDLFVVRRGDPDQSPLETLFSSADRDTHLVLVAGSPVYGDPEAFAPWGVTPTALPRAMGAIASTKATCYPASLGIDLARDFGTLAGMLHSQGVQHLSLPLIEDDPYYRRAITQLKRYTLDYAAQCQELPEHVQAPTRSWSARLMDRTR